MFGIGYLLRLDTALGLGLLLLCALSLAVTVHGINAIDRGEQAA
jgi:hypothetical protein